MFLTIFIHELRYWAKQPSVYFYALTLLIVSTAAMGGGAGVFGEESINAGSTSIANSPRGIYSLMSLFNKLLLFFLPTIVGTSIYRDFKNNVHAVLYSYPITKNGYLSAKFLSAVCVVSFIASMIGLGFVIGTQLPGVQPSLVAPFSFSPYVHTYAVYVIPNILLFGAIVFAVVAFSRNIYAGFTTVVVLLVVRELIGRSLAGMDSQAMSALLEPFGEAATLYAIRSWTVSDLNERALPLTEKILLNRVIWLAVSGMLCAAVYRYFSFSNSAFSFHNTSSKEERSVKNNFGSITKVDLPDVGYGFSFVHQLKATWALSIRDFRYILTSGSFISILIVGSLFVVLTLLQANTRYGTRLLPVTWVMLAFPVFFFSWIINLLTFLYAGMLIHRASTARVNELVDATPIPDWSLFFSKFIAIVKMQVVLLSIIMMGGIAVQAYRGYYDFDIGHYLFDLYGLHLVHFMIWACAAMFIQTLFRNPYLGLFLLILALFGVSELHQIGIEHPVFKYNQNPDPGLFMSYSELSGYGASLPAYFIHKIYWSLAGIFLLMCALLFWTRGLPQSFRERLSVARSRFKGRVALAMISVFVAFLTLGSWIYYEDRGVSAQEERTINEEAERRYGRYEKTIQPRIVAVRTNMNIFPGDLHFTADGEYSIINTSAKSIDTLLVNYGSGVHTSYTLSRVTRLVHSDTLAHFDIHVFEEGLKPGDSLHMTFQVSGIPNTLLHRHSLVEKNGTFITSVIFPGLGYRGNAERPYPSDTSALRNHYRSMDSDYIVFETTVSTAADQIAIAPGYLRREWMDGSRRYFRYTSTGKVTHDYMFASGRYHVRRDTLNDVDLAIYYHPAHEHNVGRMMHGMKAALAYNANHFSPYQHTQARIVEYSRTQGDFAQSFANTVPYSEIGFITDIGDGKDGGIDLPFVGAAHEISHQWWGLQVIPADVLGARMITESMAEYVSSRVLQQEYGEHMTRVFLRKARDIYMRGRVNNPGGEKPLMYNVGLSKSYIPYQKGVLAFHTLSDYLGEEKLDAVLKAYIEKVRLQEPPYTTSLEMVADIRRATPDSLQYLITDLFETVTLYDNRIETATATPLADGRFRVDMDFLVTKYREDGNGKRLYGNDSLSFTSDNGNSSVLSLPLADYVEIGVFGETTVNGKKEAVDLYLRKHKVTGINNRVSIIVDAKPMSVSIDPFNRLMDLSAEDNVRGL